MAARWTVALALLISALLTTVVAGTAAAAPQPPGRSGPSPAAAAPQPPSRSGPSPAAAAPPSPGESGSSPAGRVPATGRSTSADAAVCGLDGVVRTGGQSCPGNGRFRRQLLGIPDPFRHIPNPLHIVKKVVGGVASIAIKAVALVVIVGWVASGAESALKQTAKVIDATTSPQLTSSWFSGSYWRIAGIAALLTLPFLFAAAIHALVRSDLGLLTRAAFGYLPLSLLAVGIASQLTMLLLAGTDQMSSIVASASSHADSLFLARTSVQAIVQSVGTGDPFVAFLVAILTVAATLALWLELLIRDAAVYVIVLMLPLFFAAMVWPARRTLAIRAIETLIALILSKFAIVAVLSLGGTALGHSSFPGAAAMLTGATLVLLAAFSPWALLRMLPLHELASAAAGGLSQAPRQALASGVKSAVGASERTLALAAEGAEWLRPKLLSDRSSSPLDGDRPREAGGSAARSDAETDAVPGWGESLDSDLAGPVTDVSASTPPGDSAAQPSTTAASERSGPTAASEPGAARSGATGGGADGASGGGPRAPGERSATASGSAGRGPVGAEFPFVFDEDEPRLTIGEDLWELIDRRGSRTGRAAPGNGAGAGDAGQPRPAGPAPPPASAPERIEPPLLPGSDPVGPPPPRPPRTGGQPEPDGQGGDR